MKVPEFRKILGTESDEDLIGSGGREQLYAFGGKDRLYANGGDDQLYAGAGNDLDPVAGVEGDDVGRGGGVAPDQVAGRVGGAHAGAVAQRGAPGPWWDRATRRFR